jgi:hypothetical protein
MRMANRSSLKIDEAAYILRSLCSVDIKTVKNL